MLFKKKENNFTISIGIASLSVLTLERPYGWSSEFVPHFPTLNTEVFIYSKTIKIPLQIAEHARDRPQTCFQFKNTNLDFEPVTSEKNNFQRDKTHDLIYYFPEHPGAAEEDTNQLIWVELCNNFLTLLFPNFFY